MEFRLLSTRFCLVHYNDRMTKTRILQIIPTLDRCGAEKQMMLLATNLPRDEFELGVVALTRTGPYEKELNLAGIPVQLIGKRGKFDPGAYFRLKKAIRQFQPDVVHTWLFAANAYGRQAALACRGHQRRPHIIAAERCVDPWKHAWHFAIDRFLSRHTDGLVTNSAGVVDFYAAHGIPAEKFSVIPNAVMAPSISVEPTATKHAVVEKMLSELGVANQSPSGDYYPVIDSRYDFDTEMLKTLVPNALSRQQPFIIGVVARLWPQKRIRDLLWVFETLKFVNLNFHALILGDGPERDELLRCRDEWKLSDRVHFLGQRNDTEKIMPCFDVLVSCSEYEGQSNSILEAMSLGIPVVATDIPGNRDLVVEGQTGLLVPDCAADFRKRRRTFVKKTLFLLENETLRQMMSVQARQRIAEHFSLERMIERYVQLYRTLCAS